MKNYKSLVLEASLLTNMNCGYLLSRPCRIMKIANVKTDLSETFSSTVRAKESDELSDTLLLNNNFNLETYLNTDEEEYFLNGMTSKFDKSWGGIHLDEQIIENFINFCRPENTVFPMEAWVMVKKQFRCRTTLETISK